jgi:flagellar export protein FliJ
MKPFRYKLRAVAMLRERHEHDSLDRYAQALAQRAQALVRLESAERDLSAARFELQERVAGGCAAHVINGLQIHCETMNQRRARCASEVQSAERAVNQRLAEMLAARREREAVEKHHQRSRDEHRRAGQREEQKWLDDLTPQRGLLPALENAAH